MAQNRFLIISNNPLVNNITDAVIERVEGDCLEVLRCAYNQVAAGKRLLSHPLAGSVKPGQSPYKSVLLESKPGEARLSDLERMHRSLLMAEEMRAVYRQMPQHEPDWQRMDMALLVQAWQSSKEDR